MTFASLLARLWCLTLSKTIEKLRAMTWTSSLDWKMSVTELRRDTTSAVVYPVGQKTLLLAIRSLLPVRNMIIIITIGAINSYGILFLDNLGRRITHVTDDNREKAFLYQRCLQWSSAATQSFLTPLPAQPMSTSSGTFQVIRVLAHDMLSELYATAHPFVRPSHGSSGSGSIFSGGNSDDSCSSNCTSYSKW